MINFDMENLETNANILLKGLWYSELPDVLDISRLSRNIMRVIRKQEAQGYDNYEKNDGNFIKDFKNVVSPDYLRKPGVEPITYYSFKKNQSLREMQIPNIIHYVSFIYNSLWVFENLYQKLYLELDYDEYVKNSNSYIVLGEEFYIETGYDEVEEVELGVFVSSNSKSQGNQIMISNRERYEKEARTYRYGLKMDIESFFPNIYTHYFDKIKDMCPFNTIVNVKEYLTFLDVYHQRTNNNQTKGIPAGVFSAHLASELLMLCVDNRIKEVFAAEDIGYIRYVDDLTFFSDSKETLQRIPGQVQKILNEFRLRLNSNKNELFSNAIRIQATDLLEIEQEIPWVLSEQQEKFSVERLYSLKKYITKLLNAERVAQIKTILTLLNKKIKNKKMDIANIAYSLMCYCQVLVLENVTLACHGYRIIETIIQDSADKSGYITLLKEKAPLVDLEYEDTLVQIWHYYVLLKYMTDIEKTSYFEERKDNIKNPMILSMFVIEGKHKNAKLFRHIVEMFKSELVNETDWKRKIMYSKWWLPLYCIWLVDEHNYEQFMQSKTFPEVLKDLGKR